MICNNCGCDDQSNFYKGNPTICKPCFKARNAKWQANNQARVRANAGKSAALARGAVLMDNYDVTLIIPFYQAAIDLTEATGIPHEVDHKVPCCEGGKHCPTNLQVITRKDNLNKGGKRR